MMKVEVSPSLLTVGARMRAADRALATGLRRDLKAIVSPIAEEARAQAATFSVSIPQSITIRTQFTAKTTVVAVVEQAKKMPAGHEALPRLMEYGSRRNPSTIRHPSRQGPNFSQQGPIVEQPSHPFLRALCRSRQPDVKAALLLTMREAAAVAGFK